MWALISRGRDGRGEEEEVEVVMAMRRW